MSSAEAKRAAVDEALAALADFDALDDGDSSGSGDDEDYAGSASAAADAARCAAQADTEPWATKHRPASLDGVVGHADVVETLRKNMLGDEAAFPNLLFSGPSGTGKTTSILAAARDLYGSREALRYMVLEVKASDQRGIGMVRNTLGEFTRVSGHVMSRMFRDTALQKRRLPRLVILDEADSMTPEAQSAMRAMMEENMDRVRFCFIVNRESHIQTPIFSRCLRLRFPPLARTDMIGLLRRIAQLERVQCTDAAFDAMISVADGDMRQAINIMQSSHMFSSSTAAGQRLIAADDVYAICGRAPPADTQACLVQCLRDAPHLASVWHCIEAYMARHNCSLLDMVLALYMALLPSDDGVWIDHWRHMGLHDETHAMLLIDELDRMQQRMLYITDPSRTRLQAYALAAAFTRCHHLAPPLTQ